ncbi:MAG: flagellar export protein FliJ [Tissierellia bacterium]|jgi:flagellar FliJ protein|nr:flagellar export protein FliJ [Tissierellia bacterium]
MKKFIFSLQKVLEIKEQLLNNMKIELSNLNHECNNIELSIKILQAKFKNIENEYVEKTYKSISPGEMSYYKMLSQGVLTQIENKEKEKEIILRKIAAKRQEIIIMNTEISSLEKLREKELEKHNKELLKKEEHFIEEFISNKAMTNEYAV